MKKFVVFSLMLLAACAPIRVTEKLTQSTKAPLESYIGGPVFKVTRTSQLPNIFGRGDLWGRDVDRGFMELRYQGKTPDGKIVFRLRDVDVRSNETTMNRARIGVAQGFGSSTYYPQTNTVMGQSTAISVVGQEGRNEILPPNTTEFAIDPEKKNELRFGSVILTVLDADDTSIRYRLTQH